MKIWLIVLLFILILIETAVAPVPVTFIAVYIFLSYMGMIILSEIFIAGILLDLFGMHIIGVSSLFFLTILIIGGSFGKQISARNIFSRILFFAFYMVIYLKLFYNYDITFMALIVFIGTSLLVILQKIIPVEKATRRKLAV